MNDISIYFISSLVFTFIWFIFGSISYRSLFLCLYHILLGGIFLYFTINNAADSQRFFSLGSPYACSLSALTPEQLKYGQTLQLDFSNSYILYCFTGIIKLLFNNYGFASSIFSFLGFLGLNYFYQKSISLMSSNNFDKALLHLIFFLPSLSFWTSGISKESLIIFSYSLIFEMIINDKLSVLNYKNLLKFALGIIFILLVRPYTLMFLLVAIFISRIPSLVGFIKTLKTDLKTFFIIIFSVLLLNQSLQFLEP